MLTDACYVVFMSSVPFLPLDYNECSVENGGCEQKCVNQVPGYECQCDSGYSLDSDNMSCVANAECSGEGGNFVCLCLDGFRDDSSGYGSSSGYNITSCIGKSNVYNLLCVLTLCIYF